MNIGYFWINSHFIGLTHRVDRHAGKHPFYYYFPCGSVVGTVEFIVSSVYEWQAVVDFAIAPLM